jgi:hypothetical protein
MFCCSLKSVGKLPPPTVAGAGGTVTVRTNPTPQGTASRVSVDTNPASSLQPTSAAMNGTGDSIRSVSSSSDICIPNVVTSDTTVT